MFGGDLDHVNWIPSKLGGLWMGPWQRSRGRGFEKCIDDINDIPSKYRGGP